jgi:hypothetical protein
MICKTFCQVAKKSFDVTSRIPRSIAPGQGGALHAAPPKPGSRQENMPSDGCALFSIERRTGAHLWRFLIVVHRVGRNTNALRAGTPTFFASRFTYCSIMRGPIGSLASPLPGKPLAVEEECLAASEPPRQALGSQRP